MGHRRRSSVRLINGYRDWENAQLDGDVVFRRPDASSGLGWIEEAKTMSLR